MSGASIYDAAYARRYRAHDDEFESSEPCRRFADWLGQVCDMFAPPIDILDLGCGTGRYFWSLRGVGDLVGVDASPAMLAEARHPYKAEHISARTVTLVECELDACEFPDARFDLVYSIGVLAEHVALDELIVARVRRWLKTGGRVAFTTVHPDSPSIPVTLKRSIGRAVVAAVPDALGRPMRTRLLSSGRYADERRIRELLAPGFAIDELSRFESEAHLHCWCVARKVA